MSDFQQNLWAPWRMEYIHSLEGTRGNDGCFLCKTFENPADDEANYVLRRCDRALVMLNRFPYSSGHTLIAPTMHVAQLEDIPDDLLLELMQETRAAKSILAEALNPQGFNIGINLGHCAGAGLPGHLHIHIVPRWSGDTNFMAVLGDVKVIPQSLAETRRLYLETAAAR